MTMVGIPKAWSRDRRYATSGPLVSSVPINKTLGSLNPMPENPTSLPLDYLPSMGRSSSEFFITSQS